MPSTYRRKPARKLSPKQWLLIKIGAAALALGMALATSGFAVAASQEQHDSFCASCHTQPESTFYTRALDTQVVDLAAAHMHKNIHCIDCHSGSGVSGRIQAELLGAHNALAFYTGTAIQPAKLTHSIRDDQCIKCHTNVTVTGQSAANEHFHLFLARWQAMDPKAGTCVSCHQGHTMDGNAKIRYLNEARTTKVCQSCHQALGGGD
jgi:predicted CXXCH cytochrome family protein